MKYNPYKNRPHPVGALEYSPAQYRGKSVSRSTLEMSMLEFGEGELLYDIPRIVGPGVYCNLGHSFRGGSATLMAEGMSDFEVEGSILSVDTFDKGKDHFDKSWDSLNKSRVKDLISLCQGTTDEWFEVFLLKGRKFQFVFIDAGHDYLNVHNDWFNYKTLVPVGGYVAFHDTNQTDAYRVLEEGPLNDSDWEEQKELHINRIRVFKRVGNN